MLFWFCNIPSTNLKQPMLRPPMHLATVEIILSDLAVKKITNVRYAAKEPDHGYCNEYLSVRFQVVNILQHSSVYTVIKFTDIMTHLVSIFVRT